MRARVAQGSQSCNLEDSCAYGRPLDEARFRALSCWENCLRAVPVLRAQQIRHISGSIVFPKLWVLAKKQGKPMHWRNALQSCSALSPY